MILRDNPNYTTVLDDIAVNIHGNKIHALCMGRSGLINFWVDALKEEFAPVPIGPVSLRHFKQDISYMIDRILGVDFT